MDIRGLGDGVGGDCKGFAGGLECSVPKRPLVKSQAEKHALFNFTSSDSVNAGLNETVQFAPSCFWKRVPRKVYCKLNMQGTACINTTGQKRGYNFPVSF